jgi:hypothetical protein
MLAQVPGLAPGWWVGVQLDEPYGNHGNLGTPEDDRSKGIVDGVHYFKGERGSVASQPFSFHFQTIRQARTLTFEMAILTVSR